MLIELMDKGLSAVLGMAGIEYAWTRHEKRHWGLRREDTVVSRDCYLSLGKLEIIVSALKRKASQYAQ